MATKANPQYMVTGKVRASYFYGIIPAQDEDDSGEKRTKFRLQIIIDKDDKETLQKIKACCSATTKDPKALAKWGGEVPGKLKLPLRDGDTETDDDGKSLDPAIYKNKYFMNIGTFDKPGILGPDGEPPYIRDEAGNAVRDPEFGGYKYDRQFIVSGDFVRVSLKFYGYKNKGNKGITAGLNNIQLLKKGEQIGGRRRAEDDFNDGFVDDSDPENDPIGANATFDDDDAPRKPKKEENDPLAGLLG